MLNRARGVLDEAKAAGHQPNVVMYTTLINAYGRAGQLQAAIAVLDEMQAAGVSPNSMTYTSVMRLCVFTLLRIFLIFSLHLSSKHVQSGIPRKVRQSTKAAAPLILQRLLDACHISSNFVVKACRMRESSLRF